MKFVALDIAKKLKEAGFPQQECFFYHKTGPNNYWQVVTDNYDDGYPIRKEGKIGRRAHGAKLYAAPAAEDILDQLKGRLQVNRYLNGKWDLVWIGGLTERSESHRTKQSSYLAAAAAEMYLYLKENNLL